MDNVALGLQQRLCFQQLLGRTRACHGGPWPRQGCYLQDSKEDELHCAHAVSVFLQLPLGRSTACRMGWPMFLTGPSISAVGIGFQLLLRTTTVYCRGLLENVWFAGNRDH